MGSLFFFQKKKREGKKKRLFKRLKKSWEWGIFRGRVVSVPVNPRRKGCGFWTVVGGTSFDLMVVENSGGSLVF